MRGFAPVPPGYPGGFSSGERKLTAHVEPSGAPGAGTFLGACDVAAVRSRAKAMIFGADSGA